MIARALVAKALARIVYHVLSTQQDFTGLFKGTPLTRTKTLQWPAGGPSRPPSPAAELAPARARDSLAGGAPAVAHDWDGGRHAVDHLWDCRRVAPVLGVWTPLHTSAAEMLTGLPLLQDRTTAPPARRGPPAPSLDAPPRAATP